MGIYIFINAHGIYEYINDQKQGIYIFIIAQQCSSQCVIPHSAHSHYIYKCTIAGQLQVNNIRWRAINVVKFQSDKSSVSYSYNTFSNYST